MIKVKVNKLVYWIICVFFVLNTSTMYSMNNFNQLVIVLSITLISFNLLNIYMYKISLLKRECNVIIIYILLLIVLFISWRNFSLYAIYVLFVLFPNIFLLVKILRIKGDLNSFLKIIVCFCTVLAMISLFFWIFGSIFKIIKPTSLVPITWGEQIRSVKSYYNIYFETQNASVYIGDIKIGVKNNSIFPEAPICCFVFIVSFVLNELINIKYRKALRFLFCITILSTLTTTGTIFVGMVIIYFVSQIPAKNRIYKFIKLAVYLLFLIIIAHLSFNILAEKRSVHSGVVRYTKIVNEFLVFLKSPLAGHGFNIYTYGSSNSITALLADGGIILWGIYYFPLLKIILASLKLKKINYIAAIYTIVFMVTVVQYTPLGILMILLLNSIFIYKERC